MDGLLPWQDNGTKGVLILHQEWVMVSAMEGIFCLLK